MNQKRHSKGDPRGGQFAPMGRSEMNASDLEDRNSSSMFDYSDSEREQAFETIERAGGIQEILKRYKATGEVDNEEVAALAYPLANARHENIMTQKAEGRQDIRFGSIWAERRDENDTDAPLIHGLFRDQSDLAEARRVQEQFARYEAVSFFNKEGDRAQETWNQLAAMTDPEGGPVPAEHRLSKDHARECLATVEKAGGVGEIVRKYRAGEIDGESPEMQALRRPFLCELRNSDSEQHLRRELEQTPTFEEIDARLKRETGSNKDLSDDPQAIKRTQTENALSNLRFRQREDNRRVANEFARRGPYAQALWERDLRYITIGQKL